MREERHLVSQPAAVSCDTAVRADDAVARNDDADRIPPNRAANGLYRNPAAALFRNRLRDVAVRDRGSVRDSQHFVEDRLAKRCQSFKAIVGHKARIAPREILVKPAACIAELQRLAPFASPRIAHVVARTLEPKPRQRFAVPAHHEIVESLGRLVFPDKAIHIRAPSLHSFQLDSPVPRRILLSCGHHTAFIFSSDSVRSGDR